MTAEISDLDSDGIFMPLSFVARTRKVLNADHRPNRKNVRATNPKITETTSRVKSFIAFHFLITKFWWCRSRA